MNIKKKMAIFTLGFFFISMAAFGQEKYQSEYDKTGHEILVGELNMQLLVNDTSYSWFYKGINNYKPDSRAVRYISYFRDSVDVVAFFGTWDKESQKDIPAFYRTLLSASFPVDEIKLYGVDRDLNALNGEADKYDIEKIPTMILFDKRTGKEIGRIEEIPLRSVEYNLGIILQKFYVNKG